MTHTPPTLVKSAERRQFPKALNFGNLGSPVQRVLRSPRGKEVVNIQALQEREKALREFNNILGREKDHLDKQCQLKDEKISQQQKQIEGLILHE